MSIDVRVEAPPLPTAGAVTRTVKVAIFDRRPVVAEGLAELLDTSEAITIVGHGTTSRDVAKLAANVSADVMVIGIVDGDAAFARRAIIRFTDRLLAGRPRVVAVTSGERTAADLLGGLAVTVVTAQVAPESLRDAVLDPVPASMCVLPPQFVRRAVVAPVSDRLRRVDALTAREREVLRGLEVGLSTVEISAELGITPNTVRTHAQRLMSKLAVHSRVHAAAFAADYEHPWIGA